MKLSGKSGKAEKWIILLATWKIPLPLVAFRDLLDDTLATCGSQTIADVATRIWLQNSCDPHFYWAQTTYIFTRGIRTIAKLKLLTKIDFNVMHHSFIRSMQFFCQKLPIRGYRVLPQVFSIS